MCGNAYTDFKYFVTTDYLRDISIICVVMLILYLKCSVITDYLRDILYV